MCFSDWYLAIVPILIGAGMLSFWALAIATRRVPEIEAGGIEIWFHIVAETVTGVVLIAGGAAVLNDGDSLFAIVLSSLSLGMLTYTLIVSPGYYVERRNLPLIVVFGGFWIATIPAIIFRLVGS